MAGLDVRSRALRRELVEFGIDEGFEALLSQSEEEGEPDIPLLQD